MNLLSSFIDFYNKMSSDGLFFFWIIVFLFCFLIFLTIILVRKNKKLVKLLNDEYINEKEINTIDIPVIDKNEYVEVNDKELMVDVNEEVNIQKEDAIIETIEEIKLENKKEETGPYKKNVLREMNARSQTSPISINKNDVVYNTNINNDYGLDESYLREESVSPLEMMEDTYEVSDSMKFASEIVDRMEEEIKPSNIELTDYERKQEEEAIISYEELLQVKDKIYNITEEEENDEFIDELKSFRLNL